MTSVSNPVRPSLAVVATGVAFVLVALIVAGLTVDRSFERASQSKRWPVVAATKLRELSPPGGGRPLSLAWVGGERRLAVSVATQGDFGGIGLFLTQASGQTWQQIRIPAAGLCKRIEPLFPRSTGPTTVAFVALCLGERVPPDMSKDVRQYALDTGRITRVFPYFLGPASAAFTTNATRRNWLQNDGIGLRESLRWLLPHRRSAPLPLGLDRVGNPVWAPQGPLVIVPGASNLKSTRGVNRTFASWTLYALRSTDMVLTPLIDKLIDGVPRGAWSPDGQRYAASLRSSSGQRGVALIRLRDKKVVVVRPGTYGEVAWIGPNMLAAIALTRNGLHARGIELLDISAGMKRLSG